MSRHLRLFAAITAGLVVMIAAVVILVVRAHDSGGTSTTSAAAPGAKATPGGPFTPSALNIVKGKDDALRLAVAIAGSELASAQLTSVSIVQTNAAVAWQMFYPDRPQPSDWSVSSNATVWAVVAYGTFVRITPGIGPCPCTYHTAWAIAVQGTDQILSNYDYATYDLTKLGNVIAVPSSEWNKYTR